MDSNHVTSVSEVAEPSGATFYPAHPLAPRIVRPELEPQSVHVKVSGPLLVADRYRDYLDLIYPSHDYSSWDEGFAGMRCMLATSSSRRSAGFARS